MDKLKLKYDTQEEIPEGFDGLYTEKDGTWHLTGVEGLQTNENVERLQGALTKEKNDHKETKKKLRALDGVNAETVHDELEELKELRAMKEAGELDPAEGAPSEEKIEEMVNARLARHVAPIERENKALKDENATLKEENSGLSGEIKSSRIQAAIRSEAEKANIASTAIDDVVALGERLFEIDDDGEVLTRDQVGVTPSVTPDMWLQEIKDNKPHWWPASTGGGANGEDRSGGGGSVNPWSRKNWSLTEQGRIFKEDPKKAEQLAKMAGSKVGATRPPEERSAA